MIKIFLPIFILFFFSEIIIAQDISGNIEGIITDSLGTPLPGVNISVQSENLQGLKGTATNEKGYFNIFFLPVGIYKVKISMIGYRELVIENVQVRLGKTTYLGNLKLSPETINLPEITVSGEKPIIDPTTTVYGGNLNSKEFEFLPVDRNYQSMITLLPQANLSYYGDGVNIGGATGFENKYFIDGVDVTDPVFGTSGMHLPYNFINEIELKAGGYEAEFQSALGGVTNVVTKSGTNIFHGSVFGFYTSNSFSSNQELGLLDPTQGDFSDYDIGFSLGGPIVLDKLWFFAAYNPTFANHEVSIPDFGIGVDRTVRHLFAAKLNWLASQQLRLNFSITGNPTQRDAVGTNDVPPSGLENPDPYLQKIGEGDINISLNGYYSINENILLEGILARVYGYNTGEPSTERGNEIRFIDWANNTWGGGVVSTWDGSSSSNIAKVSLSIQSTSHLTSAGIQYKVSDDGGHYEYHEIIKWNDSTYQENNSGSLPSTITERLPSFFIQDSWKVSSHLRFNAGIRWDGQYVVGLDNKVAQTVDIPLQPRIGITFIPDDAGRNKVFSSYGRYSQEVSLNTMIRFTEYLGYDTTIIYPQDPRISREGGELAYGSGPSPAQPEIENLQGQYYDEFSLGYERLIWDDFKVSVQGLYRTLGQAIDDAYIISEEGWVVGNPGRYPLQDRPEATRYYSALIIGIERSGDEHFNFRASYVLSRDYGNYEGLFDALSHSGFPNQNFSFDNPNELNYITGLVPNDRTHVFKFSGSYRFLFGLNTGLSFILQSGTPLSEYTAGSNYYTGIRFLSQRGSNGRTPTIWDLGARFSYDLPSVELLHPRIIVDIFHIASQRQPVDINQRKYRVDNNGNPIGPNPTYGQAYRYQQPMSVRLGMEINF